MKKTISWLFILLGTALLVGATAFWVDTLTSSDPVGLGETIRNWLTTIIGLATGIIGLINATKKDKPSTQILAMDEAQIVEGINPRAIRSTTYIETQVVEQPVPQPETHASIGDIPPAKVVTYVHRGSIENEVRIFLKNGGTGAIVGLYAPGGLGKTELAKHLVEEFKDDFEGVLWVDVGEKKPQQVVADMLIKCNIQTRPGAIYEEQRNELKAFLLNKHFLIVLDDVRRNALEDLSSILPSKPCTTLLTSRIQQVGGVNDTFELDHMTPDQAKALMEAILGEEIVNAETETAVKLAERCAFNPLAIEIAARRIRQNQGDRKPIARFFERVQARFGELYMDGDVRWNMEHIFDISYDDLNAEDQKRFRTLAAFDHTGFAPEAAAMLWNDEAEQFQQVLSRFINLSLVKRVTIEDDNLERFRLHDLLTEYAQKKLTKDEELEIRNRLAEWIIDLFSQYYTEDRSTAPQAAIERANLLRACEWARGQKNGKLLARLITQSRNWFMISFVEDWIYWFAWLEAAWKLSFDDNTDENKQLKANVRKAIGDVQQFRDERDAALESYNEALKLFKAVGDRLGEANVLQAIGDVQQFRKENDAALESYNEALKLFKAVGAKLGEANTIAAQGKLNLSLDPGRADTLLEQAIQIYNQIGDRYSVPAQIGNFGWELLRLNEPVRALAYLSRAADLFEQMGLSDYAERHRSYANAIQNALKWEKLFANANNLFEQKNYEQAVVEFQSVLELATDARAWNGLASSLESLKRYDGAIDAYTHAIELETNSAYLYRNRASILLDQGRLDDAERDIARAVELESEHPYTRARQGYLALAHGNFADALSFFDYAAANDASKSWKFGVALSKFALGNIDEAQREIKAIMPNVENEECEDARNWLEKIVKLKPELEKDAQVLRDMLK